jgi:hypothetical protein
MTPAEAVTEELGVRPLARNLNISPSTILRWKERGEGERKGEVPSKYHRDIIRLSKMVGGTIDAHVLVYGR